MTMDLLGTLLDLVLWPALWLSTIMGAACGLLFHVWRGGGWRRFWLDLAVGALGFGLGQLGAGLVGTELLMIGEVQVLPGLAAALIALFSARRLIVAHPVAL
ncbi:MAG: hypothetical protein N2439_11230 [Anaerolineae bacterium]|nr:hypothetical protein [Anaerolineae bacterium]